MFGTLIFDMTENFPSIDAVGRINAIPVLRTLRHLV
jgi:hypothetical protein